MKGLLSQTAGFTFVAAIRMLFGEIVPMSSFVRGINREIGFPDTLSLQFGTTKGVSGVLNLFYQRAGIAGTVSA